MITMSKLAKLAHVSVSTVSKAFSMSNEVSEITREEIFSLAKQLGCFKKYYNPKYPKWVIAIICPEFESKYYNKFLFELQKNLTYYNCEVCVAATNFSKEKEADLLKYYSEYSAVDGIINISYGESLTDTQIPTVTIGKGEIDLNSTEGIIELAKYLRKCKVKTAGVIGEGLTETTTNKFIEVLNDVGIKVLPEHIAITPERFENGGYKAMEQILNAKKLPRVVLCAYDNMAIGAMKCISDNGLRVPEDIAIVGTNNIPEAEFLTVPLATVDMHIKEACDLATEKLLSELNGTQFNKETKVESTFVLRKSAQIN